MIRRSQYEITSPTGACAGGSLTNEKRSRNANRVDYIAVGKRELKERKELSDLGKREKAPEWLKAVWVNNDPVFLLYEPQRIEDRG